MLQDLNERGKRNEGSKDICNELLKSWAMESSLGGGYEALRGIKNFEK